MADEDVVIRYTTEFVTRGTAQSRSAVDTFRNSLRNIAAEQRKATAEEQKAHDLEIRRTKAHAARQKSLRDLHRAESDLGALRRSGIRDENLEADALNRAEKANRNLTKAKRDLNAAGRESRALLRDLVQGMQDETRAVSQSTKTHLNRGQAATASGRMILRDVRDQTREYEKLGRAIEKTMRGGGGRGRGGGGGGGGGGGAGGDDDEIRRKRQLALANRQANKEQDLLDKGLQKWIQTSGRAGINGRQWISTVLLLAPPIVPAALNVMAGGIGAVGSAAVAAASQVRVLAGGIGAFPQLASGVLQFKSVWKIAMDDIAKSVGTGLVDPLNQAAKSIRQLTPEAQNLARFVINNFRRPYQQMRSAALTQIAQGAQAGLSGAGTQANFRVARQAFAGTGRVIGQNLNTIGHELGSPQWTSAFRTMSQNNIRWAQSLSTVIVPLARAFRDLTLAAKPLVDWAVQFAVHWGHVIAAMVEGQKASGQMADRVKQAKNALKTFADIGQNLAVVISRISRLGQQMGQTFLGGIDAQTKKMREFVTSANGMIKIRAYFTQMIPAVKEFALLAKDVAGWILKISQNNTFQTLAHELRTTLLPALERVTQQVGQGFGDSLIKALANILTLFVNLTGPSGPLTRFLDALNGILGGINRLVAAHPAVQRFILGLAGLAAVIKGLRLLSVFSIAEAIRSKFGQMGAGAELAGAKIVAANGKTIASLDAVAGAANNARNAIAEEGTAGGVGGVVGAGGTAAQRGQRLLGTGFGSKFGTVARAGAPFALAGLGAIISSAIGGRAGAVGQFTAEGAGMGAMMGPWGAAAGALGGLTVGLLMTRTHMGQFSGALGNAAQAAERFKSALDKAHALRRVVRDARYQQRSDYYSYLSARKMPGQVVATAEQTRAAELGMSVRQMRTQIPGEYAYVAERAKKSPEYKQAELDIHQLFVTWRHDIAVTHEVMRKYMGATHNYMNQRLGAFRQIGRGAQQVRAGMNESIAHWIAGRKREGLTTSPEEIKQQRGMYVEEFTKKMDALAEKMKKEHLPQAEKYAKVISDLAKTQKGIPTNAQISYKISGNPEIVKALQQLAKWMANHGGAVDVSGGYGARGMAGGGRIPGAPVAADVIPAMLSPGEFVVTGHGEQMLEHMTGMPGVLDYVGSMQAPHFRTGGRAQKFGRGGRVSATAYMTDVLKRIHAPVTPANLSFLTMWAARENVPQSIDPYNLLGTTLPVGGSHGTNGPGVQAYNSYADGVYANASMFKQSNFTAIRKAIMSGNPNSMRGNRELAREFLSWSGGGYSWPSSGGAAPTLPAGQTGTTQSSSPVGTEGMPLPSVPRAIPGQFTTAIAQAYARGYAKGQDPGSLDTILPDLIRLGSFQVPPTPQQQLRSTWIPSKGTPGKKIHIKGTPDPTLIPELWPEETLARRMGLNITNTSRSNEPGQGQSLHRFYPSRAFDAQPSDWRTAAGERKMMSYFNLVRGMPHVTEAIHSPKWWHDGKFEHPPGTTDIKNAGEQFLYILKEHWNHVHVGSAKGARRGGRAMAGGIRRFAGGGRVPFVGGGRGRDRALSTQIASSVDTIRRTNAPGYTGRTQVGNTLFRNALITMTTAMENLSNQVFYNMAPGLLENLENVRNTLYKRWQVDIKMGRIKAAAVLQRRMKRLQATIEDIANVAGDRIGAVQAEVGARNVKIQAQTAAAARSLRYFGTDPNSVEGLRYQEVGTGGLRAQQKIAGRNLADLQRSEIRAKATGAPVGVQLDLARQVAEAQAQYDEIFVQIAENARAQVMAAAAAAVNQSQARQSILAGMNRITDPFAQNAKNIAALAQQQIAVGIPAIIQQVMATAFPSQKFGAGPGNLAGALSMVGAPTGVLDSLRSLGVKFRAGGRVRMAAGGRPTHYVPAPGVGTKPAAATKVVPRDTSDVVSRYIANQAANAAAAKVADTVTSIITTTTAQTAVTDTTQTAEILGRISDLVSAVADTADLLRQAAQAAVDLVQASKQHTESMAQIGYSTLQLNEQLNRTYGSPGANAQQYQYIQQTLIPTMQADIAAMQDQLNVATSQGNVPLANQIAEAIAGKQNDVLQQQVDALNLIQQNTEALREFTGSTGFQFGGQSFTDLIGIGVGA